jgi:predicted nucleic acid-binding protein
MKQKVVITDAGPLIALARIEHIHLLHQLFNEVTLTDTVEQEVLSGQFNDSVLIKEAIQAGWLHVGGSSATLTSPITARAQVEGLDPGEASSILWAAELQKAGHSVMLIMDEAKGRKIARQLSLDMMGSAGVIATAKRLGLIEQAKPLLLRLSESGYYLSSTVVDMALKIAGED